MADPLTPYYARWAANCRESARWLRSGEEYEEWHARRGLTADPPNVREEKALKYEADAALYESKLASG